MILDFIEALRMAAKECDVPVEIVGPEVAPQVVGLQTRPIAVVTRMRTRDAFTPAVPAKGSTLSQRNALKKTCGIKIEVTARSTVEGARPEHHWDAVDDIVGAIACAVERVRKTKGWLFGEMTGEYVPVPQGTAEQGARYTLSIALQHGVQEKTWTSVDLSAVVPRLTTVVKSNDADAGETACGG